MLIENYSFFFMLYHTSQHPPVQPSILNIKWIASHVSNVFTQAGQPYNHAEKKGNVIAQVPAFYVLIIVLKVHNLYPPFPSLSLLFPSRRVPTWPWSTRWWRRTRWRRWAWRRWWPVYASTPPTTPRSRRPTIQKMQSTLGSTGWV